MAAQQRKTRPPTPAERHAARALGLVEPEEIVDDVTPTADLHAARVLAPRKSAKPAGMQTADYYGQRALARNEAERQARAAAWGTAEDDDQEVEESEETPAGSDGVRTSGGWAFRPGGGMYLRTDDGGLVV